MNSSSISQKKLWSSRLQNHWIQPPSEYCESSSLLGKSEVL